VLIVYTFAAAWFVGGLTVFHVYLMSTIQVPTATTISPACFTSSHRQTDSECLVASLQTTYVRELQVPVRQEGEPVRQGRAGQHGYSQYVVSRRPAPKGRGHGPSRVDAHTAPHSSTPWSSTVAQLGSALDSSSRGHLINVRKNGFFVMEHRRSTNPYEASEVAC
jgi:hypothetical protein